jgi:hypothetical protein
MLVFYSPESLERLANAQTFFIFMDGTFSVPSHPFKQLYTIRVPFKDVTGTAGTLVSNCAFGVFFTGQQGLDIVVTLEHNLDKDLARFISGVGCQVFHGISGF